MVELPEMPSEDHDFTPDLARKIIAKYQSILATKEAELQAANSRIQELEARNRELEAGLRAFADPGNWVVNGRFDPHGGGFDATSFARALLSKGGNHAE